MIVANPNISQPIPFALQPGAIWRGLSLQNGEIESMSKDGYLICELYHSHRKKPIERKVLIKKESFQKT